MTDQMAPHRGIPQKAEFIPVEKFVKVKEFSP